MLERFQSEKHSSISRNLFFATIVSSLSHLNKIWHHFFGLILDPLSSSCDIWWYFPLPFPTPTWRDIYHLTKIHFSKLLECYFVPKMSRYILVDPKPPPSQCVIRWQFSKRPPTHKSKLNFFLFNFFYFECNYWDTFWM